MRPWWIQWGGWLVSPLAVLACLGLYLLGLVLLCLVDRFFKADAAR